MPRWLTSCAPTVNVFICLTHKTSVIMGIYRRESIMKQDVYETVTNKVLEMMETHGANWINPFARKGKALQPHNIISKKPYRGINHMMLLWSPYETSAWGTFKQWNEKDCKVRKGESPPPSFSGSSSRRKTTRARRSPSLSFVSTMHSTWLR